MKAKFWSMGFLLPCTALSFSFAAAPQSAMRLWVLQEPGQVVEYDPSNWAVIDSVKVPAEFIRDPDSLQINRNGQMLFCADPQIQFGNPDQHFPTEKVWLWNGQSAAILDRFPGKKGTPAAKENATVESSRRWALSSDGRHLYWFENEFTTVRNADGADVLVSTSYRVWETDLNGGQPSQIAGFSFPACECETGACSETCPEAGFWFPDEGVDDFFIVNHWIPGQIGSTYQSSHVCQRTGGKWMSRKLPEALQDVQDATRAGTTIVHRILDGGCCGWENEGNDQTILDGNGKHTILFDERRRYANLNYDVSFFTSKARISPDGHSVAITISSTSLPGTEIRLSDEGKPNPNELARLRQNMASLPTVEVVGVEDPSSRSVVLPHATLVGWLSEREILVVENGTLDAFDVSSGARRRSPIRAVNESIVFLR
jgi:hypothetical protein